MIILFVKVRWCSQIDRIRGSVLCEWGSMTADRIKQLKKFNPFLSHVKSFYTSYPYPYSVQNA